MSDYLNGKMEGLNKAFNAHWGEVMNRPSLVEPVAEYPGIFGTPDNYSSAGTITLKQLRDTAEKLDREGLPWPTGVALFGGDEDEAISEGHEDAALRAPEHRKGNRKADSI